MKLIKTAKWSNKFEAVIFDLEDSNPELLTTLDKMFCITDECLNNLPPKRKRRNKKDCDCQHSMDMNCDGGDDGW